MPRYIVISDDGQVIAEIYCPDLASAKAHQQREELAGQLALVMADPKPADPLPEEG